MTHSFLLKPGKWAIDGYLKRKQENPVTVKGSITVKWKQEYWFKMVTQLILDNQSHPEIICQYKGHLDSEGKSYTYVLQHSILGNIEGEGWISSQSIIQYHWIVGASRKRTGIDTFFYLNENVYHFTSLILESHNLSSTMEATLKHRI